MDETLYFYGEPGGKVSGPLGLKSIEVAVSAGRLGADVMLSRHGGEPWRSLEDVKKSGLEAFQLNYEETKAKAQASAEKMALVMKAEKAAREDQIEKEKDTPTPINSGSVSGIIEIIGGITIFLGFISLLCAMGNAASNESANAKAFVYLGFANILSGLMFLAVAEVLTRLKEIATILSKGK